MSIWLHIHPLLEVPHILSFLLPDHCKNLAGFVALLWAHLKPWFVRLSQGVHMLFWWFQTDFIVHPGDDYSN